MGYEIITISITDIYILKIVLLYFKGSVKELPSGINSL